MKIGRDAMLSVGAGFAGQLALIASGVALARGLGVEGRGVFAVVAFMLTILAQVGTLGMPAAIVHFLAKGDLAPNVAFRLSVRYGAMQSAVMLFVAIAVLGILTPISFRPLDLIMTLFSIPGIVAQQYALAIAQGARRFSQLSFLRVLPLALVAIVVAGAWIAGVDEVVTVLVLWGSIMFLAGGVLAVCASRISFDGLNCGTAVSGRRLLGYGLKGYLGNSAVFETFRLDFWGATVGGAASAGIYAVAQAFTNLPRFIAQGLGFVAFPVVSAEPAVANRWKVVRRLVVWNGLACGFVCAALIGSMPWLVPFFFGAAFVDAVLPSRLLVAAAFIASQRRLLGDCLRGLGQFGPSSLSEIATVAGFMAALTVTGFDGVPTTIAGSVVFAQVVGFAIDAAFVSVRYRWDAALR